MIFLTLCKFIVKKLSFSTLRNLKLDLFYDKLFISIRYFVFQVLWLLGLLSFGSTPFKIMIGKDMLSNLKLVFAKSGGVALCMGRRAKCILGSNLIAEYCLRKLFLNSNSNVLLPRKRYFAWLFLPKVFAAKICFSISILFRLLPVGELCAGEGGAGDRPDQPAAGPRIPVLPQVLVWHSGKI